MRALRRPGELGSDPTKTSPSWARRPRHQPRRANQARGSSPTALGVTCRRPKDCHRGGRRSMRPRARMWSAARTGSGRHRSVSPRRRVIAGGSLLLVPAIAKPMASELAVPNSVRHADLGPGASKWGRSRIPTLISRWDPVLLSDRSASLDDLLATVQRTFSDVSISCRSSNAQLPARPSNGTAPKARS